MSRSPNPLTILTTLFWIIVFPLSARSDGFSLDQVSTSQVILVLSENWDTIHGELFRFERDGSGSLKQVGRPFPVVLGKSGMAWGIGLNPVPSDGKKLKKEGDGKTPAGVFALGQGMGYSPKAPKGASISYTQSTEAWECVDDSASRYYNRIVNTTEISLSRDWNSSEKMLRTDSLYKWLVVVKHNAGRSAGRGSCIFFHIWRDANNGTAGCTATDENHMTELISWLRPEQNPVLVQLPVAEYLRHAEAWKLPHSKKRVRRPFRNAGS